MGRGVRSETVGPFSSLLRDGNQPTAPHGVAPLVWRLRRKEAEVHRLLRRERGGGGGALRAQFCSTQQAGLRTLRYNPKSCLELAPPRLPAPPRRVPAISEKPLKAPIPPDSDVDSPPLSPAPPASANEMTQAQLTENLRKVLSFNVRLAQQNTPEPDTSLFMDNPLNETRVAIERGSCSHSMVTSLQHMAGVIDGYEAGQAEAEIDRTESRLVLDRDPFGRCLQVEVPNTDQVSNPDTHSPRALPPRGPFAEGEEEESATSPGTKRSFKALVRETAKACGSLLTSLKRNDGSDQCASPYAAARFLREVDLGYFYTDTATTQNRQITQLFSDSTPQKTAAKPPIDQLQDCMGAAVESVQTLLFKMVSDSEDEERQLCGERGGGARVGRGSLAKEVGEGVAENNKDQLLLLQHHRRALKALMEKVAMVREQVTEIQKGEQQQQRPRSSSRRQSMVRQPSSSGPFRAKASFVGVDDRREEQPQHQHHPKRRSSMAIAEELVAKLTQSVGEVRSHSFVNIAIAGNKRLWDLHPSLMPGLYQKYVTLVRMVVDAADGAEIMCEDISSGPQWVFHSSAQQSGEGCAEGRRGSLLHHPGGCFLIVLRSPVEALRFAVSLQTAMHCVPWIDECDAVTPSTPEDFFPAEGPERSLLDLHNAVQECGGPIHHPDAPTFRCRMGVSLRDAWEERTQTGSPFFHGEGGMEASLLCGSAHPGEVLCSPMVTEAVGVRAFIRESGATFKNRPLKLHCAALQQHVRLVEYEEEPTSVFPPTPCTSTLGDASGNYSGHNPNWWLPYAAVDPALLKISLRDER